MRNTTILVLVLTLSACAETTPMMLTTGDGGVMPEGDAATMPDDDAAVLPGEDGGLPSDDDAAVLPGEDGGPVPGEDGGTPETDAGMVGTDSGPPAGSCGNRVREAGEECDAGLFGSPTCTPECTMICPAGFEYHPEFNGGAGACYGWTALATEFDPCGGGPGELISWPTTAEQHALGSWLVATFGSRTGNTDLSRGSPSLPWRWTRGGTVAVEWSATPEATHNRGTLGPMGLRSRNGMSTTSWCMVRPEG